jgi:hypothetical protein
MATLDEIGQGYTLPPPADATPTYETSLTPSQEREFQAWKQKYAPRDSGEDYDLRGAFASGVRPDPASGHWPDTFKKPNHPTFSVESQYAKDAPELAGRWQGETFIPPAKLVEPDPTATDRVVMQPAPGDPYVYGPLPGAKQPPLRRPLYSRPLNAEQSLGGSRPPPGATGGYEGMPTSANVEDRTREPSFLATLGRDQRPDFLKGTSKKPSEAAAEVAHEFDMMRTSQLANDAGLRDINPSLNPLSGIGGSYRPQPFSGDMQHRPESQNIEDYSREPTFMPALRANTAGGNVGRNLMDLMRDPLSLKLAEQQAAEAERMRNDEQDKQIFEAYRQRDLMRTSKLARDLGLGDIK